MSALDELKKVNFPSDLDCAVIFYGDDDSEEAQADAENAANELLDIRAELTALRERVEKMAVILQWIYDDGEGGTYRPDIQAVLVSHNRSQ